MNCKELERKKERIRTNNHSLKFLSHSLPVKRKLFCIFDNNQ